VGKRVDAGLEAEATNWKVVALNVGLVLIAIGGFASAGNISADWIRDSISAIASAVLTVGLVSLLYEVLLRRSIGREILKLVGVQRSLAANQIASAGYESQIDWPEILAGASRFEILLIDPRSWVEANWAYLMEAARSHPVDVIVMLPNPDSENFSAICQMMRQDQGHLRSSIDSSTDWIEQSWRNAANESSLKSGSKIKVTQFDDIPVHAGVKADRQLVILIYGVCSRQVGEPAFSVTFSGSDNSYPISWFVRQIREQSEFPATFENAV